MSSKTKIVVLRMKELIYTGIFVALGILLILLLVYMFAPRKEAKEAPDATDATDTPIQYVPGVYTSSIMLNGSAIDIAVTVEKDAIVSIQMINVSETVATMYPLSSPWIPSPILPKASILHSCCWKPFRPHWIKPGQKRLRKTEIPKRKKPDNLKSH